MKARSFSTRKRNPCDLFLTKINYSFVWHEKQKSLKNVFFYYIPRNSFTYVSLEHKSSHKQHGYICSNIQQYTVWVKIIHFYFMPKIIRILRSCSMKIFSKFPTVTISKLNFWLVICIAKNFIWTTLKMIKSKVRDTFSNKFSNPSVERHEERGTETDALSSTWSSFGSLLCERAFKNTTCNVFYCYFIKNDQV